MGIQAIRKCSLALHSALHYRVQRSLLFCQPILIPGSADKRRILELRQRSEYWLTLHLLNAEIDLNR